MICSGPFVDRALVDERMAPTWYDGKHAAPYRRGKLVESALGRLARMPGQRMGIELATVPAAIVEGLREARPGLEIVDIGPIIRRLRRSKDPDEIEVLRQSMRSGEAAQAAALREVRPGMTELDAYLIVQAAAGGARLSGDRVWRLRVGTAVRDRARRAADVAEDRAG